MISMLIIILTPQMICFPNQIGGIHTQTCASRRAVEGWQLNEKDLQSTWFTDCFHTGDEKYIDINRTQTATIEALLTSIMLLEH